MPIIDLSAAMVSLCNVLIITSSSAHIISNLFQLICRDRRCGSPMGICFLNFMSSLSGLPQETWRPVPGGDVPRYKFAAGPRWENTRSGDTSSMDAINKLK